MHNPTKRIAHTTVFIIPVAKHSLEREMAQLVEIHIRVIDICVCTSDCPDACIASSYVLCLYVYIFIRTKLLRKGGNVLFHDALNTFYFTVYGVGQIVKDHSDNERGIPLSYGRRNLGGGSVICGGSGQLLTNFN